MSTPGSAPRPSLGRVAAAQRRQEQQAPPPESRAALVRMRIKGSNTEGDLYQGQHRVKKCGNCGNR